MGSKIGARRLMQAAGVPVVPGETPADQSDDALLAALDRVGRPALVKPSSRRRRHRHARRRSRRRRAGGRSRRRGATPSTRLATARSTSSGWSQRPRHVEIQIFADAHGGCVSLFERECSIQRRHQKVIEESPSPVMTPDLRAQMGEAAVAAARACRLPQCRDRRVPRRGRRHRDAAVLLPRDEHAPAGRASRHRDWSTGLDLVRAQLLVAAGQPLPFTAERLSQRGHAIEFRVYAEDPSRGFLPQAGPLLLYREPQRSGHPRGQRRRGEGDTVSVHYDPLLAKLIVARRDPSRRARARRSRARRVCRARHRDQHPAAARAGAPPRGHGRTHRHGPARSPAADADAERSGAVARGGACRDSLRAADRAGSRRVHIRRDDPWRTLRDWRA